MNKTKSSKMTNFSRRPQFMRILFKSRNNPKQTFNVTMQQSTSKVIPTQPSAINPVEVSSDLDSLKGYVKSRMRTEYGDNYTTEAKGIVKNDYLKQSNSLINCKLPSKNMIMANCRENIQDSNRQVKQLKDRGQNYQQTEQNKKGVINFEQIDMKLDDLMQKRMKQCLQFKKKSDWNIESELTKLIAEYKSITQGQDPEKADCDVGYLEKKIKMLEKLIAENAVESQIAKKYYLAKVTNPYHRKVKTQALDMSLQVDHSRRSEMKAYHLIQHTNSRNSYKIPSKTAYNIYKHNNSFFNADRHRQPLPRSSYNRDFLTYSPIFNPPIKYQDSNTFKNASSSKIIHTSYQSEFSPKRTEKINFKELDACRDKFKNLPIIFGRKEKQELALKLSSYLNFRKSKVRDSIKTEQVKNDEGHSPVRKVTQSQSQFVVGIQMSPSRIKHENIQKLKYQYKKKMHV